MLHWILNKGVRKMCLQCRIADLFDQSGRFQMSFNLAGQGTLGSETF